MNALVNRLLDLEKRFERQRLEILRLKRQLAALAATPANAVLGYGSGGGGIFIMAGVGIAAGASVTGATVDWVIGGTGIVANAYATVWNMMQSATVSGKTIVLGLNPDGSFTVISQSC